MPDWFLVHDRDGVLMSEGSDVAADEELHARGLTKVKVNNRPNWAEEEWDRSSRSIKARTKRRGEFEQGLNDAFWLWFRWDWTCTELGERGVTTQDFRTERDRLWAEYLVLLNQWKAASA